MKSGQRNLEENFKTKRMSDNIKIANAPCSWGALEFELEGKALGYEQVLDEIAETGYAGTELGDWGFMPTEPSALRTEISKRNITLLGAFVPVALAREDTHDSGIEKALRVAGLMYEAGYSDAFIILADENGTISERTKNAGRIKKDQSLSAGQMKIFARGAEKIASAVKNKYAMRTIFHHHCAGYVETPDEIESFLNETDPNLLGLCFDTGHFRFGGGTNPLEFLEKFYSRIPHVHFKDFSPRVAQKAIDNQWDYFASVNNGIFCELGKGDVDFKALVNFLLANDYSGWIVVEQDVLPGMGDPKSCARNNRQYLQTVGL